MDSVFKESSRVPCMRSTRRFSDSMVNYCPLSSFFLDISARLCRFYKGDSRLKEQKNILEVHTTLNDVCTEDRRDDGCDNLKDFLYSIPFNHNVIVLKVRHVFLQGCTLPVILTFSGDRESSKETSTLPKAPPYMEGMQPESRRNRRLSVGFGIAGHAMSFLSAAQRNRDTA